MARWIRGLVLPLLVVEATAAVSGAARGNPVPSLLRAARTGDTVRLEALLDSRPDLVRRHGAGGRTGIHEAAAAGQLDAIRLLIDHGAPVNARDWDTRTPLALALEWEHRKAADALRKAGATEPKPELPPTIDRGNGADPPLVAAAQAGDLAGLRAALAEGADVETRSERFLEPPFGPGYYGHRGRRSKVDPLATRRQRPTPQRLGRTGLHVAAAEGHTEVVAALLAAKADPEARDADGMTPLHLAATACVPRVVELLLAVGANVSALAAEDDPPLVTAAAAGCVPVADLLLDAGASRKAIGYGLSPLMAAASEGFVDVARLLLARGADPSDRSRLGSRALTYATVGGHLGVLDVLLLAGAPSVARRGSGPGRRARRRRLASSPLGSARRPTRQHSGATRCGGAPGRDEPRRPHGASRRRAPR